VPAENESLDREQERLDAQDHGVYERDSVHCMESEAPNGTDFA
jgi:hypothetical protein